MLGVVETMGEGLHSGTQSVRKSSGTKPGGHSCALVRCAVQDGSVRTSQDAFAVVVDVMARAELAEVGTLRVPYVFPV